MTFEVERWVEQSRYDLGTAQAMFNSGRYLYVLFCCQQAVEKLLKALIAKESQRMPPPIHQLMRLARLANLEVSEEQAAFLRELSAYYIQTRYPEDIRDLVAMVKQKEARYVLNQTEEILEWLYTMNK